LLVGSDIHALFHFCALFSNYTFLRPFTVAKVFGSGRTDLMLCKELRGKLFYHRRLLLEFLGLTHKQILQNHFHQQQFC
jgi:hypothetical protein